jgi:hypothetical protein
VCVCVCVFLQKETTNNRVSSSPRVGCSTQEAVEILLNAGADPGAKNKDGA